MTEKSGESDGFKNCLRCGKIIFDDDGIDHCGECAELIEKQHNKEIAARFRERHREELRQYQKQWALDHPEQKKLIARNWAYRNKGKRRLMLKEWRKKNPGKLKAQNKRARKNHKRRLEKNLYLKGKYKKVKITIVCPKCEHKWRTNAKRPQCICGYGFPRDYMQKIEDHARTQPCKCCGREVPYQGRGSHRKYCECCIPQITALKAVLGQMKYEKEKPNHFIEWYRNNTEIIVAVSCIICGDIIPGHGGKKICDECESKWERTIPEIIMDRLTKWPSFQMMPPELIAWKRILYLRKQGLKLRQLTQVEMGD